MRNSILRSSFLILILLAGPLFVSCHDDDNDSSTIVQPATVEGLMLQKFDDIPGFAQALQRVLLQYGMNMPQPGVNLVDTGTGVTGTVGVDKDGDTIQEGTVTGTLTWNDPAQGISAGATIEITELTGNIVSLTASLAVTGATQLTFSDIVANVPVEGTRPEVDVTDGQITVDVGTSPPTLTGFVEFIVGDLAATMTLMDDGSGNPSAFIQGNGFSFTVP